MMNLFARKRLRLLGLAKLRESGLRKAAEAVMWLPEITHVVVRHSPHFLLIGKPTMNI
jgi:hypothetical protein